MGGTFWHPNSFLNPVGTSCQESQRTLVTNKTCMCPHEVCTPLVRARLLTYVRICRDAGSVDVGLAEAWREVITHQCFLHTQQRASSYAEASCLSEQDERGLALADRGLATGFEVCLGCAQSISSRLLVQKLMLHVYDNSSFKLTAHCSQVFGGGAVTAGFYRRCTGQGSLRWCSFEGQWGQASKLYHTAKGQLWTEQVAERSHTWLRLFCLSRQSFSHFFCVLHWPGCASEEDPRNHLIAVRPQAADVTTAKSGNRLRCSFRAAQAGSSASSCP